MNKESRSMYPPKNAEINETSTSIFWFDKDGILCSVSKPNAPKPSLEESKKQMEDFIKRYGKKKHCILIDAKHAKPNTAEERKNAAKILPQVTKAMAIIVHNPLGRMIVNLFIGLEKPAYPLKIFAPNQEEKAKEWLRKYL